MTCILSKLYFVPQCCSVTCWKSQGKARFTAQRPATTAGAVLFTLSAHCKSSLVCKAREIKAYDRDLPKKKYTDGASKSIILSFLGDVSVCMSYISAKNV